MPFTGRNIQNAERTTSTEPAFSNLFEVSKAVNEISLRISVGKIQEMNGAGRVHKIYRDIADLTEAVRTFIYPEEFRYSRGSLCT
jgi:hypothetical protein